MSINAKPEEVALIIELRDTKGYSWERIGRKVHRNRDTVHRYYRAGKRYGFEVCK